MDERGGGGDAACNFESVLCEGIVVIRVSPTGCTHADPWLLVVSPLQSRCCTFTRPKSRHTKALRPKQFLAVDPHSPSAFCTRFSLSVVCLRPSFSFMKFPTSHHLSPPPLSLFSASFLAEGAAGASACPPTPPAPTAAPRRTSPEAEEGDGGGGTREATKPRHPRLSRSRGTRPRRPTRRRAPTVRSRLRRSRPSRRWPRVPTTRAAAAAADGSNSSSRAAEFVRRRKEGGTGGKEVGVGGGWGNSGRDTMGGGDVLYVQWSERANGKRCREVGRRKEKR